MGEEKVDLRGPIEKLKGKEPKYLDSKKLKKDIDSASPEKKEIAKDNIKKLNKLIKKEHYDWRSTLDEKCWPGYEKKGMKTMFGKRYPNCVKKSKKKK